MRRLRASMLFLLVPACLLHAGAVKVIAVPSPLAGWPGKTTVILPDSYAGSSKKYPVIYILHGFGGNNSSWRRALPLDKSCDTFQVIFVCPDGKKCWYLDSPEQGSCLFETFFIQELLPFIDATFRTHADANGRALVGFSMGGHGAITLLAKHPDLFAGACSIAGVMDLTEFPHEWELSRVLGPCGRFKPRWQEASAVNQAGRFAGLSKTIILDCGTGDFALNGNRKEHALLRQAGVAHEYDEHPGSHDRRYVHDHAPEHIRFLCSKLTPAK